jgi:hypothetical protein
MVFIGINIFFCTDGQQPAFRTLGIDRERQCLALRDRKQQKAWEICVIRSFIILADLIRTLFR